MLKNSPIESDWDEAVRIVIHCMQTVGLNPNQLALKANLNRSILSRFLGKKNFPDPSSMLSLYIAIQDTLDRLQKISFQRVSGIEKLLLELEKNAVYLANIQPEIELLNPYKAGLQQMAIAETMPWDDAIFYYRRAEELFLRTAISHAAKAACTIVQIYINIGDYAAAQQEIDRVQKNYARPNDVETEAELLRLYGWLDFHVGNYRRAKGHFEQQLNLAKEAGVYHFGISANGFLGRIYLEFANQTPSRKEKIFLLHKAREHFELELDFDIWRDWDEHIAMSMFRLSQAHQAAESYRAAQKLRNRSRDVTGKILISQLEIEEALLHRDENDSPYARLLVHKALDDSREAKYARGLSHALHTLASVELKDGRPTSAFELAVAALCALPADTDSRGKALWAFINRIDRDSVWAGKWKSYEPYFCYLKESAMARTGNFEPLNSVSFLHENDTLDKVFSRLHPVVSHK